MRGQVMQNFSRAAEQYDAHAHFQHRETARVLDAALLTFPATARMVDIGCGTGYFAQRAVGLRPDWSVVGIDLAFGMCAQARMHGPVLQADAVALPLADASCDGVVSSLCLQWVENLDAAFAEIARVLKPGGAAVIATLGPDNLHELRAAGFAMQLLAMRSGVDYQAAAERQGLVVEGVQEDAWLEHHADTRSLLDSMRRIGAGYRGTARGLGGATGWKATVAHYERLRTPSGLPATWHRLFLRLRKIA